MITVSIEKRVENLGIIGKIKYVINWLFDPMGNTFVSTLKILQFKISFLLKTILYMITSKKINESLLKGRNKFLVSEINVIAKTRDGFYFNVRRGTDLDIIQSSREIFVNEKISPQKGDIVLDIGANIGTYAMKLGKQIGNNGKIFSIEPDPDTFKELKKNIKLNDLKNIISINKAVSNSNDKVKFYRTKVSCENSLEFKEGAEEIIVDTITVDDFILENKITKVDWIKIDVEGLEIQVLEGAKNTLKQPNLKLIIEVHKKQFMKKIDEILKENHFIKEEGNIYESTSNFIFAEKR
jgi:FkbM family methyltransferase